jgi:KDO2-lipid IV(A) lauroyltransferase
MFAVALLSRAIGVLPWRWLRFPGALLGALLGSLFRVRRRHVEESMRRAGLPRVSAEARRMYASLGTALFEFLWMIGRRASPSFAVRFTNRAARALARPGVVIATAHTGNWDLIACGAAHGYLPLTVITKRLRVGWLDRVWQSERAARRVELLDGPGVFSRALDSIRRGRSVAVLVDQAPERGSAVIEASFLGEQARCDTMAALLAARARTTLVLALGRRLPDGMYEVDVPLVLVPPERATRGWAEQATRTLNAELEAFVLAQPAQWLWLHRRWKGFAEAPLPSGQVVLSLEP